MLPVKVIIKESLYGKPVTFKVKSIKNGILVLSKKMGKKYPSVIEKSNLNGATVCI